MRAFHFEDIATGGQLLLEGLGVTLILSVSVILASLVIGTVLGILRHEGPAWIRQPVTLYIELIRSIPLVLFLAFIHYGLMFAVNDALGRNSHFLESAVVGMILFECAYIAEILRGGLRSVHPTERDAATSLGLSYSQRLGSVHLPLAFSRCLPSLINQFASLIKDTSLTSIIGVAELTARGEILYQNTYHDFEVLVVLALVYFALCFGLSAVSHRFEFGSRYRQTLAFASVQG